MRSQARGVRMVGIGGAKQVAGMNVLFGVDTA